MDTIFTLNARGNVFLEVASEYFKISQPQMRVEIQAMFHSTVRDLGKKGISYTKLKTALVPSLDHHEAALIFDSTAIDSGNYGAEVMSHVLPLLGPNSTQSVLVGDLIARNDSQEFVFGLLQRWLVLMRSFEYKHSVLLYCVYITNLTEASIIKIHEGLQSFAAYVGFIPTTYSSPAKTYLSTTLVNLFVKRERVILLAHEDDRSNNENINITPFPLEDAGYEIRSIQQHDFSHFLSYKIERATYSGFESDTHFSLNAIAENISCLSDFDVLIEDAKYEYLLKEGKLIKAGLVKTGKAELADMIRSKVEANYIYNLRYMKDHNVSSFNIVLEVPYSTGGHPARMNVSLEYQPDDRLLRVITLY